ncbi:hypothetical protein OEZ60_13070 [Defluviimonas sp. WL0024]|uniref:Uncharacterized protein n=1 Tax=Albidovulum salinarum TaxID=2984153 RepID=A0ABT2X4S4_9RHOB|nr:hypothetical protein [Defluviimonas sp. WL0024]MCU9848936.1 hypothetical protein [Defluviimonas sp. WL0024]
MATRTETHRSSPRPRAGDDPLCNWRCRCCGALLGRYLDNRLQIRFARGHEYYVTLPVTTRCRTCMSLNELVGRKAD